MILLILLFLFFEIKIRDRIDCLMQAILCWNIWLMIVIYLTSFANILTLFSILLCEFITVIIVCILIWSKHQDFKKKYRDIRLQIKSFFEDMRLLNHKKIMHIISVILPFSIFFIAIIISLNTVVYNWDSMTYHLPRLAHWAQNKSVFPYATHIDRQIGSTTLTSYVCLWVYIISGQTDTFLNLVQCAAYGIDAFLIYAITQKLGVNKRYSNLSVLIFMSLPIAFAEAATTQNDLYATIWLLYFIYLIMDFNNAEISLCWNKEFIIKVICLAACLSMGYLSKPSVCFAMVIALFWTLFMILYRKDKLSIISKMLVLGGGICLFLILPTWVQNYMVWGKFSPDNVGKQQLIGTLNIKYIFINLLKNSTYNLGNSFVPHFKEILSGFLYVVAGMFNVDLNNVSISEGGLAYGFSSNPYGCDTAMNPLVLILFIFALIILIILWKKQSKMGKQYTLFVLISYLVFCCFLRWEHFISRYMVGYFAIMCPAIVIQLQMLEQNWHSFWQKKVLYILIFSFCFLNYGLDLFNYCIDWPNTYFYHTGWLTQEYEQTCEYIIDKQYDTIGLIIGGNSYEYPLWGILKKHYGNQPYTIRHILVEDELAKYEDSKFIPDCIFVLESDVDETIEYHGFIYKRKDSDNENQLWLYERTDSTF